MSGTASSYIHVSPGISEAVTESSLIDNNSVVELSAELPASSDFRYVYYLVYMENGALQSKCLTKSHDPHLGRIWAKQVTPPHTVASLKRCICEVEGISQSACIRGQLFATTSSESALSDGAVSILTSGGLGSTADEPTILRLTAKDLTYTVMVQARCTWDADDERFPPRYISVTEDEVLYTDGQVRNDNPICELKDLSG